MKTKRQIYFLSLLTIMLLACKKDQAEIAEFNKNCSCAEEVSADFTMEEWGNTNRYTVDTDTIYANRNVKFTALEEDAEYTWYIGAEVIHERSFVRFFTDDFVGQNLPMALKVTKTPNHICLPNDDGEDSVVRYLGVSSAWNFYDFYNSPQPKWEGTFKMLEEGSTDSLEIKIHLDDPTNGVLYLQNMDGNNDSIGFLQYAVLYNMLWTDHVQGIGCLDEGFVKHYYQNNTYEIYIPREDYDYCEGRRTYHFKGRKIN